MASLILTGYEGYFTWQITGLSNPFSSANYVEAGITMYQFTTGGTTSISGVVSSKTATSSYSSTSTPVVIVTPYAPGTYTFWGYTKVPGNSTYWPAGSATVIVTQSTQSTRPSNWAWYSTVASGSKISLSAAEWNDFCTRINDFRTYAGLSKYSFTTVYSGTPISASIVNQARTAINEIPGRGGPPSAASSGDTITAAYFNNLRNALNAIP